MADNKENITCKKCHKTMLTDNYYLSNNKEKFPPDGRVDTCKKCLTMHVNNWEPSTFLNILELIDVPYIEVEWQNLMDKYGKDPKKTSSTAILGRYLAKMKLKQYANLTYADTLRIREEAEGKRMLQQQQIQEKADAKKNRYAAALMNGEELSPEEMDQIDFDALSDEELEELMPQQPEAPPISFDEQLAPEEKRMLALKWGKLYQVEEWIKLEKFYQDMMESYDIQTASHIDYLMKICKTSLKMDQAIDCGDIEGFQKLSKVYDSLMKSAKFTAAQNKAENDNYVDSIGEMVALCEAQGFIPKYHTGEPQDIVDITLADINRYTEKLIKNEMNLGSMIESALMKMKIEEEKEEDEMDENDDFINPDMQDVLEDVDYEDFGEFVDGQIEEDQDVADKEVGR